MSRKDGGSAFPETVLSGSGGDYFPSSEGGMALRDYFASAAMQGILARGEAGTVRVAEIAYKYADEMLKERES
jgi:hypothetical protein